MDRRCFVRGSCVAGLSAIGSTLGHHPTGGSLASHTAGQLFLSAPSIVAGQVIAAVARYRLVLYKDYHGYSKDHFSSSQPKLPKAFRQQYLYDSPGIQTCS